MINTFKEKLRPNAWEWIPFIGTIIFSARINLFKSSQSKQFKRIVFKWKSIVDAVSALISITFIVLFFSLRNKHGYGSFPWFFWVGLGFAIANNFLPIVPTTFINIGFKEYIRLVEVKEIEEDKPLTFKEATELVKQNKSKDKEEIKKPEETEAD